MVTNPNPYNWVIDADGLHRVDLSVLAYNTRAIACYRACGFIEEGRERQAALVDGTWHDFVVMGILEYDWHRSAESVAPGP